MFITRLKVPKADNADGMKRVRTPHKRAGQAKGMPRETDINLELKTAIHRGSVLASDEKNSGGLVKRGEVISFSTDSMARGMVEWMNQTNGAALLHIEATSGGRRLFLLEDIQSRLSPVDNAHLFPETVEECSRSRGTENNTSFEMVGEGDEGLHYADVELEF